MSLECPNCGATFRSASQLNQVCNVCSSTCSRESANLIQRKKRAPVLICHECSPMLDTMSLEEVLSHGPLTSRE